jgi:signal transduction histidine kinase
VGYEKSGEFRGLAKEVSIHVYRIAQEALNNVAKHSHSKRVAVRLRFLPQVLILEVHDEGIGFHEKDARGLGLVSMRERAEMVNGEIEFVTGGTGALVRLTVPLEDNL